MELLATCLNPLGDVTYTISIYKAGKEYATRWNCPRCVGFRDEGTAPEFETAMAAADNSIHRHHADYHSVS
jgi:hypothetical protein